MLFPTELYSFLAARLQRNASNLHNCRSHAMPQRQEEDLGPRTVQPDSEQREDA